MINTVYGLFEEIVKKQSEAVAIIENKRAMTFQELSEMVDRIADSFPDGTKAVGIVMRHRAEMIASILAVLKTGAMYVPAEPIFPTGRIHYMMDEAKVDFVLTEMQIVPFVRRHPAVRQECIDRTRMILHISSIHQVRRADQRAYLSRTGMSATM